MKTTSLFTTALIILLSIGSCKKDPLTKNTNTNTTDTLTLTKTCSIKKIRSFSSSNQLTYEATYYLTGKRIDSLIAIGYNPSYVSKQIYTYTSPLEAKIENYYNGVKNADYSKMFFDANYNYIRTENYTNNNLASYSTFEYECN